MNLISASFQGTVANPVSIPSLRKKAAGDTAAFLLEMELKNELERIFYARGIYVENVLLSEISQINQ